VLNYFSEPKREDTRICFFLSTVVLPSTVVYNLSVGVLNNTHCLPRISVARRGSFSVLNPVFFCSPQHFKGKN